MNKIDENALHNAEEIIQRFGGIRPMASKLDVPVTTVQGWKKRNVIPGTRYDDIVVAAREHNVDVHDLLKAGAANENTHASAPVTTPSATAEKPPAAPEVKHEQPPFVQTPPQKGRMEEQDKMPAETPNADMIKSLKKMERSAVAKSTIINIVLIVAAIAAIGILLWPRAQNAEQSAQKVAELEADMQIIKQQQSNNSRSLIPENINERLAEIQRQAEQAQAQVGVAIMRAEEISNDVLSQNAGNLEQRITKLEEHVNELAAQSPQFASMIERVQGMQQSLIGREKLDQATAELSKMMSGMQGQAAGQFNEKLNAARQESATLGQTFEGVPADDLKAAALLLGLTQFRNSLNRGNEPFQNDLTILMGLIAEDNTELRDSMTKLAPHAESGVLTPDGLSQEFRSLTGEIVVASLKGEDVSIQDRAKARLNELLQVQKDGELITGTETQAKVARTQNLLEQGDLAAAIAEIQTLQGPAAEAALPWLKDAQATLNAQQAKALVSKALYNMQSMGGGTLVRDEATGINVLKPAP